jgi:outer membrane immunogenic protein
MKRLAIALLAVTGLSVGFGQIASAADLPVKAPVYKAPPPVAYNWTGCYIGANAGYGWANKDWTDSSTPEGSNTSTGGLVGGQIGCDYQFASNWVVGIQGMYDWANLNGGHSLTDNLRFTDSSKVSSLATLTGRIGYLAQPETLLYIKGGAAWVRDTFTEDATLCNGCPGVAKVTRSGWDVGGGLEYLLQRNWSIFVEYNYMDFGRRIETLVFTNGATETYQIKQNVQTVLVGLNYRLDFGKAPFVARY